MYIYLHGFNSTGASAKGQYLKQHLFPIDVLTPTYCSRPDEAVAALTALMKNLHKQDKSPVLIGSSLGGYYAQYLAHRYRLPCIMINPALVPIETLRPYLGWQINYYTNERYYFDETELLLLENYNVPSPCHHPVPTLLLLDRDDEVIDYRTAESVYRDCGEVVIFDGGSHRFEHLEESIPLIQRFSAQHLTYNP